MPLEQGRLRRFALAKQLVQRLSTIEFITSPTIAAPTLVCG